MNTRNRVCSFIRAALVIGALVAGGFVAPDAHGQVGGPYSKFGPVNGIMKGSVSTYNTSQALSTDVTALFCGTSTTLFLRADGTCAVPAGGVSSVTETVPAGFAITGSPGTGAVSLAISYATGQSANLFLATPNGTTGALSERAIVGADVPPINLGSTANGGILSTSILTGTNGGTSNGFMSFTGPSTSLKTFTLPNASANILTDNAAVTVAQGGTGLATLTAHGVLLGEGTSNVSPLVMGADTVLRGTASADPVATSINNCGSSTTALSYSTSTHTFGCQTITSGGTGTVTSVAAGTGLSASPSPIVSSGTISLDLTAANTWSGVQTFNSAISIPAGFGGSANTNSTFASTLFNSNGGTNSATSLSVQGSAGHGITLIALGASNTTAPCSGCFNVGDSATLLAGGSGGLSIAVATAERIRLATGGRITINAATNDATLVVNGASGSGNYAGAFASPNVAGSSFGVSIAGGTNTSDFALSITGANGSATHLFQVDGTGRLLGAANYSSAGAVSTTAAGIFTTASDLRLKDVVGSAPAGLKEVLQLKPIRYRWNKVSELDDPAHTVYTGFGAQDVLAVIPDAVGKRPDGYYTLYDRPITAALVNAVKEQQREIEALRREIRKQTIRAKCTQKSGGSATRLNY